MKKIINENQMLRDFIKNADANGCLKITVREIVSFIFGVLATIIATYIIRRLGW